MEISPVGKRHVVLVGAGAVGVTLAGFLRQQDHRVTLITRTGTRDALPLRISDEINDRELTLEGVKLCQADELPPTPDQVVICTRGEQLEEALRSLRGKLEPSVPVTIAAATFDSLPALARTNGLANPILRMGVGFAAWPVSQGRHRVYGYMPRGSAIACEGLPHDTAARNDLSRILSGSGLPTQAAPSALFGRVFRAMLAVDVAWLLTYRRAHWELEALLAQPDLLALGAAAMREAVLCALGSGALAHLFGAVPRATFTAFARRRASSASQDYREVWRHHGPKIDAQTEFLSRQLIVGARRNVEALRALSAH